MAAQWNAAAVSTTVAHLDAHPSTKFFPTISSSISGCNGSAATATSNCPSASRNRKPKVSRRKREDLSWEHRKPNCPDHALIAMAMMSAGEGTLPTRQIYTYIEEEFPYLAISERTTWKGHVMNSLTRSNYFREVKTANKSSEDQLWEIAPALEDPLKQQVWYFIREEIIRLLKKDYHKRLAMSPADKPRVGAGPCENVLHAADANAIVTDDLSIKARLTDFTIEKCHTSSSERPSEGTAAQQDQQPQKPAAKRATIEYFPPEGEEKVTAPPTRTVILPFSFPLNNQPIGCESLLTSAQATTGMPFWVPQHANQPYGQFATTNYSLRTVPATRLTQRPNFPHNQTVRAGGAWQQQQYQLSNSTGSLLHARSAFPPYPAQPPIQTSNTFCAGHSVQPTYKTDHPAPSTTKTTSMNQYRVLNQKPDITQGNLAILPEWGSVRCLGHSGAADIATGTLEQRGLRKRVLHVEEELEEGHAMRATLPPFKKPAITPDPSSVGGGRVFQQSPLPLLTTTAHTADTDRRSGHSESYNEPNAPTEAHMPLPSSFASCNSTTEEEGQADILSEYWKEFMASLSDTMQDPCVLVETTSEEFQNVIIHDSIPKND